MNKTLKSLTFAVILTGSAQFSLGQERGEMLQKLFSRMDKNQDGLIEESEAPAEFWSRIAKADSNQDGKIDKTEAAKGMRSMSERSDPGKRAAGEPGANTDREKGDRKTKESTPEQAGSADRIKQLFDRYGKDGKIALEKLPEPLRQRLAKLDTNEDKMLEQSEMKGSAAVEQLRDGEAGVMFDRVRQMMQSLDKDGDGKIAVADIPGEFRDRLSKLDKNGDGLLERSEIAELRSLMGDKGPGASAIQDKMQQMFSQFDKDGDGKVALTELPEMLRERLAKMDSNGDGLIEKSELKELAGKRSDEKSGDKKTGEGRYGWGGESTAPQAPKRPSSDDTL